MAPSYVEKGIAALKTSGTTVAVSAVDAVAGDTIIAVVAFDNSQGEPTVTWKGKPFRLVPGTVRANAGTGKSVGEWRKRVRKSSVAPHPDVVATFDVAIAARVIGVVVVKGASKKDVNTDNAQDATGAPTTGAAVVSNVADTLSIAGFMSAGPGTDTAASSAGAGHTLGQRAGTTGAPPASNVTLQMTYEILAATGNIRATLSGATSRDWAATIAAYAPQQTYTVVGSEHYPWDADTDQETMRFDVEDEASAEVLQVRIPVEAFNQMTDAQVSACITYACQVHAEKQDGDSGVNPVDADLETRAATFHNDTVTV